MAAWDLGWLTGAQFRWLAAGCLLAVVLSALVVRRMIGLAVMDVPGHRSAHDRPTPKGGGVGMVAAVLIGTPGLLALLPGGMARLPGAALLLAAVLLLAVVSWLDDLRQFGFQAKLAAQLAAALMTVAAALATASSLPPWPLLPPGILLATLWLMLVTNAMNFIDGINGLASGCSALTSAAGIGLGLALHDPLLVAAMTLATAGLLGFLPFNYPSARIFMGDVGSQPCGLLAGALALFALADGAGWSALLVPMLLAGILWDVLLTLARRAVSGERLTQAHRGHLYQRASRQLMSPARVTLLHWGFVVWGGCCGLLLPGRIVPALMLVVGPQLVWTLRAWR